MQNSEWRMKNAQGREVTRVTSVTLLHKLLPGRKRCYPHGAMYLAFSNFEDENEGEEDLWAS